MRAPTPTWIWMRNMTAILRTAEDKIMAIIKRYHLAIMQEGLHASGDGNSQKHDLKQRMHGAEAALTGIL